MASSSGFYAGSQLLIPLASMMKVSVDQINFTVCQIACIGLGFLFRKRLSVFSVSAETRYITEAVLGVVLLYFCFGYQLVNLFVHAGISYLLMRFYRNPVRMPVLVFVFAMGYLSICHILRQIYDYGGYTLDITGPLMVLTQKLTGLAFSYADGQRMTKDPAFGERLTEHQRRNAVAKMPSLLQFSSYCLYFHGTLLGPFINFADYTHFIESYELATLLRDPKIARELNHKTARCVFMSGFFLALHIFIASRASVTMIEDDSLGSWFFMSRIFYTYLVLALFRVRYYFAWSITEALNLAAGLGHSGYNEKTRRHEWNLSNNFVWRNIEMGNSMKAILDFWNISTSRWLRDTMYDRLPRRFSMVGVFMASAFWHGFYPGYYLAFLSVALFTAAGRLVRKIVRPMFVSSTAPGGASLLDWRNKTASHLLYDFITTITALLTLTYALAPFLILEFRRSLNYWRLNCFYLHIASVLVLLLLPRLSSLKRKQS